MRLHHVGVVTDDIDLSIQRFAKLGFLPRSNVVFDGLQDADLMLLGDAGDVLVELVKFHRASRMGLGHLCFEVDDVEKCMVASGGRVVSEACRAVLFGGRRVGFVFVGTGVVVEFLERESIP